MNTNGTNPGMNVEDYEDKAVQKSKKKFVMLTKKHM